jgi:uncharacterized membrane protein YgcG
VPPLQARLTDLTGTLTTEQQTGLEQSLRAFESRKGTQIAVLIVPTTKPEEIEQYTLRVVKQWKLGRKKVDDGALLLIAKDDRSLRVEVGYGIEGALHAPAQVKRAFPHAALNAIEQALKASETTHTGEVHFVVEGALDGAPLLRGQTAKERALALFSELRMWDTEHNTGVLIYLLLADGAVEIVADRGIHAKAGPRTWVVICHEMEAAFKAAKFENGAVSGIQAVTRQMVDHFPADAHNANELPDKPLVI